MPDPTKFHLQIITPEAIIFDEDVKTVSGTNVKGKFDILPFHINFVSIISGEVIVQKLDGTTQTIPIKTAILKAFENYVHIFVGIEEPAS